VVDQVTRLKFDGERFSFMVRNDFTAPRRLWARRTKILSYFIIAVIAVLILFSATFLVTIRQVLCNPGHSLLPGDP